MWGKFPRYLLWNWVLRSEVHQKRKRKISRKPEEIFKSQEKFCLFPVLYCIDAGFSADGTKSVVLQYWEICQHSVHRCWFAEATQIRRCLYNFALYDLTCRRSKNIWKSLREKKLSFSVIRFCKMGGCGGYYSSFILRFAGCFGAQDCRSQREHWTGWRVKYFSLNKRPERSKEKVLYRIFEIFRDMG